MNRRNWVHLSRKLVDVNDLDYSFNAVQYYMAQNNLAFFGLGVLTTTTYPNPFPVSLSSGAMAGLVGKGIGYDPTGLQVRIDDTAGNFTIMPADPAQSRLDLLVLRYKAVGDTQIPEPDAPTNSVYLNIHDGYELVVIPGTPGVAPVYPPKGAYDVILAGIEVPAAASVGTDCNVDLSLREIATPLRTFFPTFKQETPAGTVDGTNTVFNLSAEPLDQASLVVSVNGLALPSSAFGLSGTTITLAEPPAPAQDVYAYYVVNAAGSVNPVSGVQEVPTGTVDGTNQTFTLSQEPVDQNSMQVYVDGLVVPISGWSLVQNPLVSQIVFNAGFIPQAGQDVYAFYLRNAVAQAAPSDNAGAGGGTGASVNLSTEYPQLSANDIQAGYVTLSHTPVQPTGVLLDLIGGSAQAYGSDFTVSANKLYWIGDLATVLSASDRLRIHYAY